MRLFFNVLILLFCIGYVQAQCDTTMSFCNGKLKGHGRVDNKNQQIGRWVYYYSNGNVQSEGDYLNNLPYGEWKNYLEDGRPLNVLIYNIKGQREGYYKEWNFKTNEICEGNFVNDSIKIGLRLFYDINGNKLIEGNYTKNKRHGIWKWYYPNKQLQAIGRIRNGLLVDKWEYFFDNGNKDCKGKFVDGLKEGEWIWYDKDLIYIKLRANYHHDKKDGLWTWFDTKGHIIAKVKYKNDEEIE